MFLYAVLSSSGHAPICRSGSLRSPAFVIVNDDDDARGGRYPWQRGQTTWALGVLSPQRAQGWTDAGLAGTRPDPQRRSAP